MDLRWLTSNIGIKILALFLSVLLWFHAHTERMYIIERKVPINYILPQDTLFVITSLPKEVTIRIKGKGKNLLLLSFSKLQGVLNLRNLKAGKHTVKISPENVGLPSQLNLQVVSIMPPAISTVIDNLSKRRVRVEPQIEDTPEEGYFFTGTRTKTRRVYLLGPSQLIADYRTVKTEPISLNNRKESFSTTVRLLPPFDMASTQPESVVVKVTIEPAETLKLDDIPINVVNSREGVEISPTKAGLVVSFPRSYRNRIKRETIKCSVDVKDLSPGEYLLEVQYALPDKVELLAITPEKVRVNIKAPTTE